MTTGAETPKTEAREVVETIMLRLSSELTAAIKERFPEVESSPGLGLYGAGADDAIAFRDAVRAEFRRALEVELSATS